MGRKKKHNQTFCDFLVEIRISSMRYMLVNACSSKSKHAGILITKLADSSTSKSNKPTGNGILDGFDQSNSRAVSLHFDTNGRKMNELHNRYRVSNKTHSQL